MSGPNRRSRRRLLELAGATASVVLAGCSGDGGGDGTTPGGDTVPQEYRTATSQGGQQRNPDQLSTKEALNYQESPNNGQQCSGCLFYIADKNGDGMGACTLVEGNIDPEGWCSSYSPNEG